MDPIIKLVLVPDLSTVVGTADPERVTYWLREVALPGDRSRALARLSADELTALARFAATDDAVELLDSVDDELAARFLRAAEADDAVRLLDALDSDRVADILRELKGAPRQRILDLLPAQRADRIRGLLSWPQDSAAAHMVPEMLTVSPGVTVAEAIAMVRAEANALRTDARTGAYVFIVDDDARLGGVVGFRDLVLAEPETPVDALADTDVRTVNALDDAEDAARALDAYDLVAVPVIDEHGRLLGIVTEDDAADIAEEEATEDAERQGGSSPLDVPYLRASPLLLWRKRIVWLLLLFVAEAYTGTVLRAFEDEMEAVVALAFFIPLLIGTGGNTGTQITTTLVRAMATGQVRLRDVPAVLVKELSTGSMVALTMALAAVIRAWTLGVGPEITLTVALTVAAIVMWSSLISSILPPLLKKIRIDPALVSAPLIATIVDGTGLIIYFLIAHATLSQLQGL
ncbi:magnesium transporter MgtE [Mycolicibacterium insubricum]|jgi:magnesium transporter|uniref:Magnesium transporter MgtE n=1 Tax=Mycolicibacterium insubricum TaxID=444597 RepID=A0A1X0D5R7_9MYCO|nr:magnesium transporter [Mycolicibacterium insubricum]MCB9441719.1 magnesium transporter [Mycolicibacterium sp.]ORA67713.1 magnesium transporter [Mycolicibacterium insubricum]BBZ67327.1 magnesium transporter MgtE [Mycolicibacterium insubricum]